MYFKNIWNDSISTVASLTFQNLKSLRIHQSVPLCMIRHCFTQFISCFSHQELSLIYPTIHVTLHCICLDIVASMGSTPHSFTVQSSKQEPPSAHSLWNTQVYQTWRKIFFTERALPGIQTRDFQMKTGFLAMMQQGILESSDSGVAFASEMCHYSSNCILHSWSVSLAPPAHEPSLPMTGGGDLATSWMTSSTVLWWASSSSSLLLMLGVSRQQGLRHLYIKCLCSWSRWFSCLCGMLVGGMEWQWGCCDHSIGL